MFLQFLVQFCNYSGFVAISDCGECMITLSLARSGACNLAILNCPCVRTAAAALCLRSRNAILPSVLLVQFARPGKHLISYAVVFVSELLACSAP